jgi:hypothetical protein
MVKTTSPDPVNLILLVPQEVEFVWASLTLGPRFGESRAGDYTSGGYLCFSITNVILGIGHHNEVMIGGVIVHVFHQGIPRGKGPKEVSATD